MKPYAIAVLGTDIVTQYRCVRASRRGTTRWLRMSGVFASTLQPTVVTMSARTSKHKRYGQRPRRCWGPGQRIDVPAIARAWCRAPANTE